MTEQDTSEVRVAEAATETASAAAASAPLPADEVARLTDEIIASL